ncbi:MAG: hypothetical protein ACJ8E3_05820 [Sphingomicrobium sp.]
MDRTPHELRLHAEHCRHLADSQIDERVRLILKTMASEFDQQARDLDPVEVTFRPSRG